MTASSASRDGRNPITADRGALAAVTDVRPLVLLRHRCGITGHTARTVHLAPMPLDGADAITALCGALLHSDQVERVSAGQGMPCTQCLLRHLSTTGKPSPTDDSPTTPQPMPRDRADTTPLGAATLYRAWGWPVTLRGDHVRLNLSDDVVSLIIPVPLAVQVTAILRQRRCPPAVLAHPCASGHQVLLAGELYGVTLPWPPDVRRVTGALLLPPSITLRGPIIWIHPPEPDALRHCREIDVITALRFVKRTPPLSSF